METRGWSDVATGQRLLTVPGRGEEARNWKRPEMIFPLEPASGKNSPADTLSLAL